MVQLLANQLRPRAAASRSCRARVAARTAVLRVVAFKENDDQVANKQANAKVTFQLPMHVEFGQELAVVGAAESLGSWDIKDAVPMAWTEGDVWTAQAEVPTGSTVEYKYVILAGEGSAKAVLEWQPCDNLALQAEEPELTIRDAWQGEQHEVLPGTLRLPAGEEEAAAAGEAQPEPMPAPVAVEAEGKAEGEAAAPVAAAAPAAAAAAADAVPAVMAATAPTTPRAEPAPVVVPVAEPKAAASAGEEAAAAPARDAPKAAERRRTSSSNGAKPPGGNSQRGNKVVAATAAAPPAADKPAKREGDQPAPARYGSLTTNELKVVCKQRGLSTKGQRKDLLSRLQKLLQQGPQA